jgi:hypothetical protein
MCEQIDILLKDMQGESPNCGGIYHFNEVNLPDGGNLVDRLKNHLLSIKAYQKPFVDFDENKRLIEDRMVSNLRLTSVSNYKHFIEDRLRFWREHRTSLDSREDLTDQYYPKEKLFKESVFGFLNNLAELKTYKIDGIDTYFAHKIGGDMVGDDIIFESKRGVFVLHFGWSS